MKKAGIVAALEAGKVMVQAEYRSLEEATSLKGTSAKGKPYAFARATHNLEIAGKPFQLTEKLDEKVWMDKTGEYKTAFSKGQPVLAVLDIEPDSNLNGLYRVTGVLDSIEPDDAKAK